MTNNKRIKHMARQSGQLRMRLRRAHVRTRPVLRRLGIEPTLSRVITQHRRLQNRWHLINFLIHKHNYTSYLEIGCARNKTFKSILVDSKVGVDPARGGTIRATSDNFFAANDQFFDLIFVDGLHHAEQVLVDVENSLRVLKQGGTIVMHDCSPLSEERQCVPRVGKGRWNGDVWRAVVMLRTRPDLDIVVGDFDQGCGVVRFRPNSDPLQLPAWINTIDDLTYQAFSTNRKAWLRLVDEATLRQFTES